MSDTRQWIYFVKVERIGGDDWILPFKEEQQAEICKMLLNNKYGLYASTNAAKQNIAGIDLFTNGAETASLINTLNEGETTLHYRKVGYAIMTTLLVFSIICGLVIAL